MVATPSSFTLSTDFQLDLGEVSNRLTEIQQRARATGQGQILSMVLPVPPCDPLAVLQCLRPAPYFYFEKPWQGIVTAAWEPILQWHLAGTGRFAQAQALLQSWQPRIQSWVFGASLPAGLACRFFCSFSFSDHTPEHSPFPAATLMLPHWQLSRCQGQDWLVCNLLVQLDTEIAQTCAGLQQSLQCLPLRGSLNEPNARRHGVLHPYFAPDLEAPQFKQSVVEALKGIARHQFAKLVLAEAVDWVAPRPVDIFQSLAQLRQRYPDCYIFSTSNGQGQNFLGASPERLLSLQAGELIVDALAGSAPRGQTPIEDFALAQRLLQSDKERREHQVLVDYIVATLKGLGLVAYPTAPTRLLTLPNIQHLQTLIAAQVPTQMHLLEILAQLHPTPAVAGFPRQIACEQIQIHEPFERGLYAAPLGWIEPGGDGEFVVGLRSALIDGPRLRLYAGAGIVAGSNPDRELQEIQLKFRALLESLVWA
jgi:menaquinone-specific isochorismate synthase